MISVEGLKVEFGVKPLFNDVSFVINDRDRIALVGKNGAGKSTMLKILCGLQKPTSGVVAIPNETTIGYLPQVMKLQDDTTVKQETRKAFAHNTEMKARLDKMQQEMADRTDYESESYAQLVEKFTQEHDRYMMMGGENYEAEIERTLSGLGFTREDFDRPTREFSGGWRMRIELAKILLQKPDVLLLDEPTNHLDIESIQWLEQFLAQSAKAVVLVSHDRAFINNVTNRTLEITCGRVEDYKVKYDEYVVLRAERREQQLRAYENQQKEIADIKDFIERFRYKPTKAVQVQSRIKQLEKIVPIEVDEVDNKQMHLKFPPCLRSGDYPVICDEVRKDYGEHTVFDHVNLTIKRGEKVAFVGKNGEGKSTLVKCIMGEIPFTGNLKIGHNVQIGYFAQNQAQLLAVLTYERHFLATLDGKVHMVEDGMLAIILSHLIADNRIIAATETRRELEMHLLGIHLVHLDRNDFLQLLDAALHLYSLGWLIAESLDEVLDIGYFLLLVLVGAELLLAALGTKYHILIVFHLVILYPSAGNLQGAVGYIIDKGTVVTYQHHRLGTLRQELLQPLDTLDIKMVGRLIEEKYIRLLEQDLCQLDTHTPSTGELSGRTVEVFTGETQTAQRALYLSLVVFTTHHHIAIMFLGEFLHELGIALALVVGAVSHFLLHLVEARLHLGIVGEEAFVCGSGCNI